MTIEQAVPIRSTIPTRLYRLGWSPFHTRMVAGLGAAWILDGLQITISSSVTGVLLMAAGGVIELVFGIKAEGKPLEAVSKPLMITAS